MNLTPDDPNLSAYFLGELAAAEMVEVERAAAADPAIRLSLDELAKTVSVLDASLSADHGQRLLAHQRHAILRTAREMDAGQERPDLVPSKRDHRPWLVGLAAAAAVTIGIFLMSRMEFGGAGQGEGGLAMIDEIALLPMPGPRSSELPSQVGGGQDLDERVSRALDDQPGEFLQKVARHLDQQPLPRRESLPPTGNLGAFLPAGVTKLPVVVGDSSLQWIAGWIRERNEIPPRDAVRIEEMINTASLPSLNREGSLSIGLETMPCPWDRGTLLAAIQLRADGEDLHGLELAFESATEHRVLGSFHPPRGSSRLPDSLPEDRSTLLLLQLRSGAASNGGGFVVLHGGNERTFPVPPPSQNPSAGLQHASLLAGFGIWLRGEGLAEADLERMLRNQSADSDPVRADVRAIVAEALVLHAER